MMLTTASRNRRSIRRSAILEGLKGITSSCKGGFSSLALAASTQRPSSSSAPQSRLAQSVSEPLTKLDDDGSCDSSHTSGSAMADLPPALSPGDYADHIIYGMTQLKDNPTPLASHALTSLLALFPSSTSCPAVTYLALTSPLPEQIIPELRKCKGFLRSEWEEMAAGRARALLFLGKGGECKARGDLEGEKEQLHQAYESYGVVTNAFVRHLGSLPPSTSARPYLPILIHTLLDLRRLAVLADKVLASSASSSALAGSTNRPQPHLEACARQLNKAFTTCVADRNPDLDLSRKWATYRIVAILFRTYFKLKSLQLCRNILRALSAAPLPAFSLFPRSDRVTFRYYTGYLNFLSQEWNSAYNDLMYAWENCHHGAKSQQAQILVPLLPLMLTLKGALPNRRLIQEYPQLAALYSPFFHALTPPSLATFEIALQDPMIEAHLVKRGVYLAVEGFRFVLLRCLIKKLWMVKDRGTRISLDDVEKTLGFAGWKGSQGTTASTITKEEVEWLVGGLIARGYIKGYISHERRILVVSNVTAFPRLDAVGVGGLL